MTHGGSDFDFVTVRDCLSGETRRYESIAEFCAEARESFAYAQSCRQLDMLEELYERGESTEDVERHLEIEVMGGKA